MTCPQQLYAARLTDGRFIAARTPTSPAFRLLLQETETPFSAVRRLHRDPLTPREPLYQFCDARFDMEGEILYFAPAAVPGLYEMPRWCNTSALAQLWAQYLRYTAALDRLERLLLT